MKNKMTEEEAYSAVKKEANAILNTAGFSWDDLPDTNSIWDWICDGMTSQDIRATAKDCCWDRLYDSGMDRDLATTIVYGKTPRY